VHFPIKLVFFVLALAVICPGVASAQSEPRADGLRLPTTMFAAAAAADWITTYNGIKHFRLREMNPLIRRFEDTPAKMVVIGGAIDAGAVFAWNHVMGRRHPRVAAAGLWTMTAFRAYLAFHNIRNAQRAGRR
jgi:hypothetical protein